MLSLAVLLASGAVLLLKKLFFSVVTVVLLFPVVCRAVDLLVEKRRLFPMV